MPIGKTYQRKFGVLVLALGGLVSSGAGYAQRINFSTWTGSDDISITPVMASPTLNFNEKQTNISANSPAVIINLADLQSVAFRIEAPEGYDLTVEVDAPSFLSLEGIGSESETLIPFRVGIGYNNLLAGDEMTAKAGAVQLPLGFYNVTFPINRRMAGAPGPPPTPISGDYVRPKATAWLFIQGELGPIGQVNAGQYLGDITINVYFTSNE
jgi:hypothetical protein